MNILIVSATILESKNLIQLLNLEKLSSNIYRKNNNKNNISLLVSGVGLTFTAYALSKELFKNKIDLVINIGIAGSFNKTLKLGEVVQVISERFADLGIRDKNSFKDIFEAGFLNANEHPFENATLKSSKFENPVLKTIKKVKGISVNTTSGNKNEITQLQKKYLPDIESMEGAAVFYVCHKENVPVLEIRSISNYVEERDKNKWDIPLAIKKLDEFIILFLKTLEI